MMRPSVSQGGVIIFDVAQVYTLRFGDDREGVVGGETLNDGHCDDVRGP